MAVQVVTPENFQQLIETGRVDDFKPPEAPKPADDKGKAAPEGKQAEAKQNEPQRGADGKFTKSTDSDTSTRTDAKSDDDEGSDDLPEKARRAIGKKHRLQKEAEEFAREQWRKSTAAEQRAEKAERELAELKTKSGPAPATEAKKEPQPDDFKTVAEYSRALAKFWAAEELQAERDKADKQRQEAEQAERQRAYGKRVAAAEAKYDDFREVVQALAGTDMEKVPLDVTEYIQESEHGAELLYYLAKNTSELDRMRKLSPRRFIAELGKLETKWEKQPEAPAKLSELPAATEIPVVSRAPAPVQTLEGKSSPVEKDPAKMSFRELREHERQKAAEKRR